VNLRRHVERVPVIESGMDERRADSEIRRTFEGERALEAARMQFARPRLAQWTVAKVRMPSHVKRWKMAFFQSASGHGRRAPVTSCYAFEKATVCLEISGDNRRLFFGAKWLAAHGMRA
jgi:hypothetical protein